MNEDILSFIWRYQYFEMNCLKSDEGQQVSVIRPGYKNVNSGPDFSQSAIEIDGVKWHGSVEIHVKASDWYLHSHQFDQAYENVILHVVWLNDKPVYRRDGTPLPTLSLQPIVRQEVLDRYALLQQEVNRIPCSAMFDSVIQIHKYTMLDRALLERLDRKAQDVLQIYEAASRDWEETAYRWILRQYGFKLNEHAFARLASIIPFKIFQKHRPQILQVEALLFGCAGLIPEDEADIYIRSLRKEFRFLSTKYKLSDAVMQECEWKFAKLRPPGFPTVRIAQLAKLICKNGNLFGKLIASNTLTEVTKMFQTAQSDYWKEHYVFSKKSTKTVPSMGTDATALLIINAVVPLLVAYSKTRQQPELLDRAIYWLSQLPAEDNRITREWETLGMSVRNAADSQALIEWYNNYCLPKKCLECAVGGTLVRPS